jgi:hypothetical protein
MVRTCDPLGVNDATPENASHFNDGSREYIANGNATNSTFPYHSRTDIAATIEALQTWVAPQSDPAVVSTTLILIRSLKNWPKNPTDTLRNEITTNTAHWEAAVRAGR